jgi:hypothetical protein
MATANRKPAGFHGGISQVGLWESDRDCWRLTDWGRGADQTSPMRGLGANVAPRPERPAGSQTHKSRRGLGESRYRGTLADPGASLGQPC